MHRLIRSANKVRTVRTLVEPVPVWYALASSAVPLQTQLQFLLFARVRTFDGALPYFIQHHAPLDMLQFLLDHGASPHTRGPVIGATPKTAFEMLQGTDNMNYTTAVRALFINPQPIATRNPPYGLLLP